VNRATAAIGIVVGGGLSKVASKCASHATAKLSRLIGEAFEKRSDAWRESLIQAVGKLSMKPGATPQDVRRFSQKIEALQDHIRNTQAFPNVRLKVSAAERKRITRQYRSRAIETAKKIYGRDPAALKVVLDRIRLYDVDHVVDLVVGGSNTFDNLKFLRASDNRGLGASLQQIMKKASPNLHSEL
jgi:ribosomal protein S15P/S13E